MLTLALFLGMGYIALVHKYTKNGHFFWGAFNPLRAEMIGEPERVFLVK